MMPESRKGWMCLFFLGVALGLIVTGPAIAKVPGETETRQARVVVLHAYHHGFTWSDSLSGGIGSVFEKAAEDAELRFEFLDTRFCATEAYLLSVKKALENKYANRQVDVVIACDDHALNFMLRFGKDVFRNVPVVFCSVSGYRPEMREHFALTGLRESIDIRATVDAALHLHPETQEIAVILDQSRTGRALKQTTAEALKPVAGRIRIRYLEGLTVEQLKQQLPALAEDTLVLLFIFPPDETGRVLPHEQNLARLRPFCPFPIYSVWQFYLGHGIVGGRLSNGHEEGRMAAGMALRILKGEDASDIPLGESPVKFMFDHTEMTRFGIDPAILPDNALVIHKPFSFYDTYKKPIWAVSGAFFILIGIIALLVISTAARKKAENELTRMAREWQATFDAANDGILVLDQNQQVVQANKTAERYLQCTIDRMRGKPYLELIRETAEPDPESPVFSAGKSLQRRKTALRIGERWFEITEDPILDATGEYAGAVHIVSDITEQKQTTLALEESEERYRTLVEQSPLGISLIGRDGRYRYINPRFQEMFGYGLEEVQSGAEWFEKAFPDQKYRETVVNTWVADLKKTGVGRSRPRVFTVTCKDGSQKETYFRPVTLENMEQFVIYEDITETTRMERQLQQAQKMESVGRLAGGVAHDFNNMLGVILGRVEMLLMVMKPGDPHYVDLEEVHKAAQRSAELTRQLLAFARKQTIAPKVLDLNDTVEGILKMLRRLIGEDIDLVWKPDGNLWPVRMDPAQVDQILANLCVNARDAIPGTGKVTIETENADLDRAYCETRAGLAPGQYVMLAVSDDGAGMEKETLDKAFEPFFTTKGLGEGTGLGLAMVYGIVKQNNGFISVYSEPGQGTTFKIYLPRSRQHPEEENKDLLEAAPEGSETVLLVEDEASILDLAKSILERFGYSVLSACTPGEAIATVKEYPGQIHLLVTDVVMPEMNGKELKTRIARLKPDIKVLFISGYTANVIMHRGILESDVQFLQKPFSVSALAGKVREVLDRKE